MEPAVTIPADTLSITIGTDGTVSAIVAGQTTPQQLGQIQLAKFSNPAGLEAIGRNLFRPSDASGTATTGTPGSDGFGFIAQGYLEMSNVNVVEEMVSMITSQRAYEVNSRAIRTADEMLRIANSLVV
jgi:flagellar basal-body rod protein FlgG